jgi:hypothetical protein
VVLVSGGLALFIDGHHDHDHLGDLSQLQLHPFERCGGPVVLVSGGLALFIDGHHDHDHLGDLSQLQLHPFERFIGLTDHVAHEHGGHVRVDFS